MIGKGKGTDASTPPIDRASASSPEINDNRPRASETFHEDDANIGIAINELPEPTSQAPRYPQVHNSRYAREPSYPYTHNHAYPSSHYPAHAKIKASYLPKFKGNKGEDVETRIEQLSAIFEANKCSDSKIVAFLSVILKDTALKWFTRLGPKGRFQFPTWMDWQDALRQRFLKANYLAEKKRLWKKRDLRPNEDIADYPDAKVDLQAYVFDDTTPESELILDILDGLPDYMLPTFMSSITAETDLLDFRRILLDYEKGLRRNGPWNSRKPDGNSFSNGRASSQTNDRHRNSSNNRSDTRDTSKPPKPCSCGGMHWYR